MGLRIQSVPTVKFIRGGDGAQLHELTGDPKEFMQKFQQCLQHCESDRTTLKLKDKTFDSDRKVKNIETSVDDLSILASMPLACGRDFILLKTRQELGMEPVDGRMAFDVSKHSAAATSVAQDVVARLKKDVSAFADAANTSLIGRIDCLLDTDVDQFFAGADNVKTIETAKENVEDVLEQLYALRKLDQDMMHDAIPLIERVANWVKRSDADSVQVQEAKSRFLLSRIAGEW